jgi:hypothetical protein
VNEQEMFLRVGELAGRVGYPMPTVNWVEGVIGEDCIRLQENRQGVAMLTVHDHVNEFGSEREQELLITQELVRARLGIFRQRRRCRLSGCGCSGRRSRPPERLGCATALDAGISLGEHLDDPQALLRVGP